MIFLAHGIGGVRDLPVPESFFFTTAAVVLVVSFVLLGLLWKKPLLEQNADGHALPRALSAFFLVWSLPMTLLGTLYAVGYLRPYFDAGRNGGPHFALLKMVSLSFVVIYSVQNALVFLLGWEIAAVAAWLLVIWE